MISAAPGSGKTTRIPPMISQWTQGQILVLEPRRVAATAAASRIAFEQNWELGQEVGYQVRFENKSSKKTRVKFLTEALLSRQLLTDPHLKGVDVVILDEFHERSIHVDLALSLLREMQLLGSPLKIVVMSATLDAKPLSEFLGNAPIISSSGKIFDLKISYEKKPQLLRTTPEWYERLQQALQNFESMDGDILVFLPGVGEIHRLEKQLQESSFKSSRQIQTLYAQKPLAEQNEILRPHSQRRLILSTNLAESALTINGVRLVIDSGLEKRTDYDEKTQQEKISLSRIALSSAAQRAGRAAREGPGHCHRLWTPQDELSFLDYIPAEILRTDLSTSLLLLATQGVSDFQKFSWFESPTPKKLQAAVSELQNLQALDAEQRLTTLGKNLLRWPVPLRWGLFLESLQKDGSFAMATEWVALAQEKDVITLQDSDRHESDIADRWRIWKEEPHRLPRFYSQQIQKVSAQLQNLVGNTPTRKDNVETLSQHLAFAFQDRIGRRRKEEPTTALSRSGFGFIIDRHSAVQTSEFLIPLKSIFSDQQNQVITTWSHGLKTTQVQSWFAEQIKEESKTFFDSHRQKLVRESRKYLGAIPLTEPLRSEPTDLEIQEHFPQIIASSWDSVVKENSRLKEWWQRWIFLPTELKNEIGAVPNPDLFQQLAAVSSSLDELYQFDIVGLIEQTWDQKWKQNLNKNWPLHWKAPSGREFPVHYQQGQKPFVELRVQDVYGLKTHPFLGEHQKVPLVFHLLAPNQRPLQVTADIVGFWNGSYKEIKKEMKGRYPKHSWPEDPMNETPGPPVFRRR